MQTMQIIGTDQSTDRAQGNFLRVFFGETVEFFHLPANATLENIALTVSALSKRRCRDLLDVRILPGSISSPSPRSSGIVRLPMATQQPGVETAIAAINHEGTINDA